jgi:AAA+ ATPase superfamily predicted ATPase
MFIGRDFEILQLREMWNQCSAQLSVIYGRRRVGKTALIKEAFSDQEILYFDGLEDRPKSEQIDNFISQLKEQTAIVPKDPICKWREAFSLLVPLIKQKRVVIVFDELQWMANYRSELLSDLKSVWDRHFIKETSVLILCGSVASFMVERVIKGKALYGRTDKVIHLRPFKLHETAQFFPERSKDEILFSHLVVGGIPTYLKILQRAQSAQMALANEGFEEGGYFITEFDKIFVSHFGKNTSYELIVNALASDLYGKSRAEIAQYLPKSEQQKLQNITSKTVATETIGGGVSQMLDNLEVAEFIASYVPFDKPANSKLILYMLIDPYIRFYLSFIKPLKIRNIFQNKNFIRDIVPTPEFRSWLGRGFELLCMNHSVQIATILGFGGITYRAGPYFRSRKKDIQLDDSQADNQGVQFDLIFDRADKVLTICEMKYQEANVGLEVGRQLQEKINKVSAFEKRTVQKVLISKSPATKELERSGVFYRTILAEELFLI